MKRFLALLLALAMVFAFAACGEVTPAGEKTDEKGTPAEQPAAAPASETDKEETAAGGAQLIDAADAGLVDLVGGSRLVAEVEGQSDDAVLRLAYGQEPVNLDPWEARGAGYIPIMLNVFECLFKWDSEAEKYVGWLAESYEWRDDTTLVVHLRQGVKFHSGNEMKAEDVLFTMQRVSEFIGGASRVAALDMEKSYCEDDYTVVFITKYHAPALITHMSSQICVIEEKAWVEANGTESTMNGTGAYRFASWDKGVKLVVERFDDYWDADNAQCYYKTVESYFYNDMTTAFLDFEVGNLDIVKVENSSDLDNLIAGAYADEAYYMKVSQNGIQLLCFYAPADERFDDVRVRQAFCEAIDMESIVTALCGQVYDIATSTLPATSWAYKDESAVVKYDPDHAKTLVEELTADGVDMTFTVPIEQKDNNINIAEAMQAQLAAVGITLNIEPTQQSDFMPKMNAGEISLGFGGSGGGFDPIEAWFPVTPNSGSIAQCLDEEAGELMTQAADAEGAAERIALYEQVQDLFAENYRYLPMYEEPIWYAVSNSVANVDFGLDHCIHFADVVGVE